MSNSKFLDEKVVQNAVIVSEDEKEKANENSSPFYTIIFSGKGQSTGQLLLSHRDDHPCPNCALVRSLIQCHEGCALMSDGYQVGVLSLVNVCLGNIYGDAYTSTM